MLQGRSKSTVLGSVLIALVSISVVIAPSASARPQDDTWVRQQCVPLQHGDGNAEVCIYTSTVNSALIRGELINKTDHPISSLGEFIAEDNEPSVTCGSNFQTTAAGAATECTRTVPEGNWKVRVSYRVGSGTTIQDTKYVQYT